MEGPLAAGSVRLRLANTLAFALSAYALYWVVGIVDPQVYRVSFLLIALLAIFLLFPLARLEAGSPAAGGRAGWSLIVDGALIALTIAALAWPILDFSEFVYRAATPTSIDVVLGTAAIVAILEATRRTTGWVLPATAVAFMAYALLGPALDRIGLDLVAHRGYAPDRLVATLYMTLEGIFGVPLDVTATYIILFTIFGAVLEHGGAGRFFVRWAMAAMRGARHRAGPGRTVAAAGYLLGSISGSGVANTVMLGSFAWPMLQRAGYSAEIGGAILAASGLGALLAPPTMGAAAFLIAEYLNITYFQVVTMAAIPAALYYVAIFLTIEAESRRLALEPVPIETASLGAITRRGGHHFVPLAAVVVLMARGFTAFRAVFWATLLGIVLSFRRRDEALTPRRLAAALAAGGRSVLPIAATTATAGIVVGVVTLTGLGLKVAGLIVTLAGGSLLLTVLYAAVAVWTLGLAVPVTASYIIAAVMIAPALTQVGVAEVAAHLFVFYYAVLSEVSPPTALSPFAAAAITGGNPFRTTMLTWKYTAPAFIVPVAFTIDPRGLGVLLQAPAADVFWSTGSALVGIAALAAGAGGWLRRAAAPLERVAAAGAGVLLVMPMPAATVLGALTFGGVVSVHWWRTGRRHPRRPS
ncbi:MAG TPA: TRAP transporter fused permease subunit [Vicinamibacterales bacterium]|nr:TRAP transporter fused permease subunit [Vicinamibacterales bacterium]